MALIAWSGQYQNGQLERTDHEEQTEHPFVE